MTKHKIISRWVFEWSVHRTRFFGLGLEIDGGKGGVSLMFALPFVDLTLDIWSREHLKQAAEQLAELKPLAEQINQKVDWGQYAPRQ